MSSPFLSYVSLLSSAGLDSLQPVFDAYGVTDQSFCQLQFQDYDAMGIFEPPERQKLFKLIQQTKQFINQNNNNNNNNNNNKQNPPSITSSPNAKLSSRPIQTATSTSISTSTTSSASSTPSASSPSSLPSSSNRSNGKVAGNSIPSSQSVISSGSGPSNSSIAYTTNIPTNHNNSNSALLPAPAALPSKRRSGAQVIDLSQHSSSPHSNHQHQHQNILNTTPAYPNRVGRDKDDEPESKFSRDQQSIKSSTIHTTDISLADDDDVELDDISNGVVDDDEEEEDESLLVSTSSTNPDDDSISKIRVAVRKRPINSKEKSKGDMDVATVNNNASAVTIHEPKMKVDLTKYVESHKFCFDEVFDEGSTNEEIYTVTCRPLINFFLNKGKATCFAYGQTGSGKTFTMMGPGVDVPTSHSGLYVLAARDIFQTISSNDCYRDLQVWVSFFEIYGGKLFDLLNDRKKLICREDAQKSVNVVGLIERQCGEVNELLDLIAYGNGVRSTGSTGANIDSSRSHAILQIAVKKLVKKPGMKAKLKIQGKFSFIDLAGSERAADTSNNDRRTRLEGAEINKSLLALKECIRALDQGGRHLPFRGSQLTQVLKDSFVGNSRTIMIANISPNSGSCEHTLNTLRYADRVKELKKGEKDKNITNTSTSGSSTSTSSNVNLNYNNSSSNSNKDINSATNIVKKEKPFDAYMPHQGTKGNVRTRQGQLVSREEPNVSTPSNSNNRNIPSRLQQPTHINTNSINNNYHQPQTQPSQQQQINSVISQPSHSSHSQSQSQTHPSSLPHPFSYDSSVTSDDNSDLMQSTYDNLCSAILSEEDAIVDAHRAAIDSTMKQVKEEMELLKKHDTEIYSVDEYVDALDSLLSKKIDSITDLRSKLSLFKRHLSEEAQLSSTLNLQSNKGTFTKYQEEEGREKERERISASNTNSTVSISTNPSNLSKQLGGHHSRIMSSQSVLSNGKR